MTTLAIGPFHAGEIPPPLQVTFDDQNGLPVDFSQSGPWTAKFSFRSYGGVWVTAAAVVAGGSTGVVTYTWQASDLATAGDFEGEMWIGNAGAQKYDSKRIIWQVLPATVPVPTV